jgi:hypothetical protein
MIILPANTLSTGYEVDNSCRFDDGSSPVLSRTNGGSPTSSSIFTFSCWIKKSQGVPSEHQVLFGNFDSTNNTGYFRINDDGTLRYYDKEDSTTRVNYTTTAVFRDVSAWYNLIVNVDTSRSSGDRVRFFSNGTQVTASAATDTSGDLGLLTATTANAMTVGVVKRPPSPDYEYYFDGYMAECVFIDGQALAPTSFGEFDDDSPTIWKPKDVSGLTFGTNGFYLDFKDSGDLGDDESGNGNDFAETNLATTDQVTDTPTNNFATWNPLKHWNDSGTIRQPTYSEGNTRAIFDDSGQNEQGFSTIGVTNGKWYCEIKATDITANANTRIGIGDIEHTLTSNINTISTTIYYAADGNKRVGSTASSYGDTYADGDIIGIALDLDNNKLYFSKNGTFQDSGDPTSGSTGTGAISVTDGYYYCFIAEDYASSGNTYMDANFGSPSFSISSGNSDANGYGNFEYAVPSGYYALCTKNLADYG